MNINQNHRVYESEYKAMKKHYYKNITLFIIFIFICFGNFACGKQNKKEDILDNILYNASIGMSKEDVIKNKKKIGYTDYGAVGNTIIYNYMPDYFGYDTKFITYEFDENDKLIGFGATFNECSDEMYQILQNKLIKELGKKSDENYDNYNHQTTWNTDSYTVKLLYFQSVLDDSHNLSILVNKNNIDDKDNSFDNNSNFKVLTNSDKKEMEDLAYNLMKEGFKNTDLEVEVRQNEADGIIKIITLLYVDVDSSSIKNMSYSDYSSICESQASAAQAVYDTVYNNFSYDNMTSIIGMIDSSNNEVLLAVDNSGEIIETVRE